MLWAAVLVWPAAAAAQAPAGYLGGGVFLGAWQPDDVGGSPSLSFDNTSDDSTLVGAILEAGVALGRQVTLGAEVGFPPRRDVSQVHFYSNPFRKEVRYRDTTLFGVARVRVGQAAVSAELVAGGGLVHQSSLERTAQGQFGPARLYVRFLRR